MHQGVGFVKLGANRNSKKKSLMEGLGGGGGGGGGGGEKKRVGGGVGLMRDEGHNRWGVDSWLINELNGHTMY